MLNIRKPNGVTHKQNMKNISRMCDTIRLSFFGFRTNKCHFKLL